MDSGDSLPELPEEILVHILSYVPGNDLIHACRIVCKSWKSMIDYATLWIRKCERDGIALPAQAARDSLQLDYRVLYFKNPYGRNLLKNWNAEGMFTSSNAMGIPKVKSSL